MVFKLNTSVSSSYGHLAIVFFGMITILTVIRGVFRDIFKEDYLDYLIPIVAPFGVLFFLSIVRLVRKLGVSERLFRAIVAMLIVAVLFRISSVLFVSSGEVQVGFALLSSACLLSIQGIAVYFMCNNLFIEENPMKEKLWASVCVYFMIGSTFGTLYSLVLAINPGAFGTLLSSPMEIYIIGLVYSFNIISGLDPVYENVLNPFV